MAEAGLDVTVDAAANLVGRRPGRTGRWLATGSHLDTVIDAGPYDGAYGVVAAVEVAAALRPPPTSTTASSSPPSPTRRALGARPA